MSFKKQLQNPFFRQYIVEILFPIIGYYFFDWSLAVIGAFYLIDQFSAELFFFRRCQKINAFSEDKHKGTFILIPIILFLFFFTTELVLIGPFWLFAESAGEQKGVNEIVTFARDELWLLFPLVLLIYYIKDQFTFYVPRRYLAFDLKKMISLHYLSNLLIVAGVALMIVLIRFSDWPEPLLLVSFIVGKLIYDLTFVIWVQKKSLR